MTIYLAKYIHKYDNNLNALVFSNNPKAFSFYISNRGDFFESETISTMKAIYTNYEWIKLA